MKIKFQWFFDLSTKVDEMQIITVSAGGPDMVQRLTNFFSAYKYYRLGKISCKFVPASTLPVDPTGLSYGDTEQTVDPRDQLTPGLTRITNGEDIFEDFSSLTADEQRKLYYTMMLDPRWYKWSLQSGLRRTATPLYWSVGQYHQDKYPGMVLNLPNDNTATGEGNIAHQLMSVQRFQKVQGKSATGMGNTYNYYYHRNFSDPRGLFQTGHRGKLGWLPTDGLEKFYNGEENVNEAYVNIPACIECFKIITPPSNKTIYYYRVYVTETVYFRSPIVNQTNQLGEYTSLDRFVRDLGAYATLPTSSFGRNASSQYGGIFLDNAGQGEIN